LEIVYRLSEPYGARKWQIEKSHSKQTHQQNAKSAVRQQTDQRRTANSSKHLEISKQQQNFKDQ
jgi:hypothetical protein